MAVIDPTTNLGKLRLKVGDITDLQLLPDSVYTQTLVDTNNNLTQSTGIIAGYILAILSQQTHQKLVQIEVFGNQWFEQYVTFIKLVVLNPNLSQIAPVPYAAGVDTQNPLTQFTDDWYANYAQGTQSQRLHDDAALPTSYTPWG